MSHDKLLKFAHRAQELPEKRPAQERAADFQEIVKTYLTDRAANQSGRCAQCGVPFCQIHCPLSNNIPDWLYLTAQGRLEEAYHLSTATNYFPEVCGRVCPQDKLCEGGCVVEQAGHGFVTIGSVEKYITEHAFAMDWVKPITPKTERLDKIAIIGAGPAGLSAGIFLRMQGYEIHLFDRYDRAGGLMIYGIPNFKLEKSVILRRQALLEKSGFHFHFGVDVGKEFKAIQKKHASVVIATGVYKNKQLDMAPHSLSGVVPALPFLIRENKLDLASVGDVAGTDPEPALSAKDKVVAVIGGGDTAMDCVRTAVRQGAKKVYCLYRRDRANMPGSAREVANAEEEGVEFLWLTAPMKFHGDPATQQLAAIDYCAMTLSERGADGRQTSSPMASTMAGSEKKLPVDLAILALGFDAENCQAMFGVPAMGISPRGTLRADAHGRVLDNDGAVIEKTYAAGDIVRGASLVVWAIKDGMTVGKTIHDDIQRSLLKNKKQRAA